MSYKGISDGTESKPFADFEQAIAKAADGDTIVIKGKAFANAQEEGGVTPIVIDKRVTITGYQDAVGALYLRAGGMILGADVVMHNVELNFANKYHNAIFLNGYHFTANNVKRGSGSREVHLIAGGIGAGTQVTAAMPNAGSGTIMTLTDSEFGNIYAGGVMTGYTGDITVTANRCTLGSVYGSGAQERAPDGNWFDTSEPPAPEADRQYAATGTVHIRTDGDSIKIVDAMGCKQVAVTAENALESRLLKLTGVTALTVNSGKATVVALDEAASVNVSDGATLNLSRMENPTLGSLSGKGTLNLDKAQTLNITGSFGGTWNFETGTAFDGKSGLAEYDHAYIVSGSGTADVRFVPHSTQTKMTLNRTGNEWRTSALTEPPTTVSTFSFQSSSKTLSVGEFTTDSGTSVGVNWTSSEPGSDLASLKAIPLRYVVTYLGKEYSATASAENDFDVTIPLPDTLTIGLAASDAEGAEDSHDKLLIYGNLSAGMYQIAAFAPDADENEIRADFTLILTNDDSAKATAIEMAIPNVEYGDAIALKAVVKAEGAFVPKGQGNLEFYLNGTLVNRSPVGENGEAVCWQNEPVLDKFKLGANEVRVIYDGAAPYAPAAASVTFMVSKAQNARIIGGVTAKDSIFNGSVNHSANPIKPVVQGKVHVLNESPAVTVEYRLNGELVKEPVFPGVYTVKLKTAGTEKYEAIEQDGGSFTIHKASPAVAVAAEDKGNGTVILSATVSGVVPYFATGKVNFAWGDETFEAELKDGVATYTVTGAEAKEYRYLASFEPQNDPYYVAAGSGAETITPTVTPKAAATTTTITAPTANSKHTMGGMLTLTAEIAANQGTVDGGEVTFSVNGTPLTSKAAVVNGVAKLENVAVSAENGFALGENVITAAYGGVENAFEASDAAPASITVEAAVTQKYELSFNVNGGKETIAAQDLEENKTPAAVKDPTRDGYEFAGWSYNGNIVDLAQFKMPAENVELIAQWNAIAYTIHYDANNGNATGSEQSQTYKFDGSEATKLSQNNNPGFELEGFTVVGWILEGMDPKLAYFVGEQIGKTIQNALLNSGKDHAITLYAVWKENEKPDVTVTFDAATNGGKFADGTAENKMQTGKAGDALTLPDVQERPGFAFDGWFTADGTKITAPATIPAASATYYARWTAISYTIHFDTQMEGVTGGPVADLTYKFDGTCDTMTLPAGENLRFAGHTFLGWGLVSGDQMTIFAPSSTIGDAIRNALLASATHEISLEMAWVSDSVTMHTIAASAGTNGTISPNGSVQVEEGKDQTFTITAAGGYEIEKVLVDGVSVGAVPSYTFHSVTGNHTISVTFKKSADTPVPVDPKPMPSIPSREPAKPSQNPNARPTLPFADVTEGAWYRDAVEYLYVNEIMNGVSQTIFEPERNMTRGMITTMLHRVDGKPFVSGNHPFLDAQAGYFASAIRWAQQEGIMVGTSATQFSPNAPMTREQLAVALYRYAKYLGRNTGRAVNLSGFEDGNAVSSFAREAMAWAVAEGLLTGVGGSRLAPTAPATRAQVAVILYRFLRAG